MKQWEKRRRQRVRKINILSAIGKWKMEPLPDYGDLFTIDDWLSCVKIGGFIDYDGYGNLSTETEMSNIEIRPSQAKNLAWDKIKEHFTHVVWFNR